MNHDLAAWLDAQRAALAPRWADRLAPPPPRGDDGAEPVLTIAPSAVDAGELLTAAAAAARGEPAALDELLRALALPEGGRQPEIAEAVALVRELHQAARQQIRASAPDAAAALDLSDALGELFDRAVVTMVEAAAERVGSLLSESEFLAASLDAASDAADRRALQLQSLNVIGRQLSSILDVSQLVELVVNSLRELTGVAHVALWQPAENGVTMDDGDTCAALVARRTLGAEAAPVTGMWLAPASGDDLISRAFASGAPQFEMQPDPAAQGQWLQPGCGALALPMVVGAEVVAVAVLQDPDPVAQLRFQQDVAQGVIGQAGIALQNARLYAEVRNLNVDLEQRVMARTRELQEEKDRIAMIHQISTEVSSTLDLDNLLNTSLQLLSEITRADHASIMLVEQPDSSLLVTRAVLGVPASATGYLRFPIGAGIAGWVAQHRESLLIDDISRDERWVTVPGGSLRRREGAMLAVPLVNQGEVLGVITLSHRESGYFHEGHLRMLNACAGAIAIGINNANLFQTLMNEAERRAEILEQQRTEASKINAILQSLNDGVIVCDLYGNVLAVNGAAGLVLQRKVEDLVLWNLHEILARYLGPRAAEMPLELLLKRPLTLENRPRFYHSQMKVGVRTVSLVMGPVLKDDGELVGALLVLRDITREVESDRLKTEFIGTMSHELRTPMTAIKGFTQLLSMGGLGPLTDTQKEFVTTIYSNTERMIALINDVLDITKIESGSVELELRPLHLAEALSGVVAELKGPIADRGHQLSISIPPGLPLVRADAFRLHQVLFNLLSNAVKYTPRGGAIAVEAHEAVLASLPPQVRDALDQDRRYTQLSIRDTGVGIAPEDQQRIFDRFYRTENPLKIEAGGTGLGLSLVRPLIQILGGRIWVVSEVGEGSAFSFVLPAAEGR
jgi:signal transduction histidine kinase/putative methionine-R-sulfoxide reductase with GAF domain